MMLLCNNKKKKEMQNKSYEKGFKNGQGELADDEKIVYAKVK